MFAMRTLFSRVGVVLTTTLLLVQPSHADTVVLPTSSFDSYSDLETYWNYLYPWGDTHNGAARMVGNSTDHDHISVSDGVLTLTANPYSGDPDSDIHYLSGTIYAKEQVTVGGSGAVGYQVGGEFISPTDVGTWPAFWLTGVNSWPPESDIGEWKGTQQCWFNTFNTSTQAKSTIVSWPQDGEFHALKAVLRTIAGNAEDLTIQYYLDNELQATHTAANFSGKAMYLIVDLQMEGSSGTPGPTNVTTYQLRNVQMTELTS